MMHRMPTENPRITITLTPSTHSLLKELSALTGESMSATVADLLASSEPVFQRMVTVLRAAQEVQREGKASMVAAIDEAQSKIEQQLGLALETLDDGFRPILANAEKVRRRAGRSSPLAGAPAQSGHALTPPSNRGVRSTANPLKKAKSSKKVLNHGQV